MRGYEDNSEAFREEVKRGLHTVIAIDPAIAKKETADYTAIVTMSATFDATPKYYVRKGGVVRGHWTLNQTVMEGIRLYDLFQASALIIETTAYQEALADEFRRYCEDNRRFVNIVEVKPDKDKERRAHVVAPIMERGQIYFDYGDPMTQILIEELILFPTGDRDDLVDAFVYDSTDLKDWTARPRDEGGPHIVTPKGWKPNKYTGVG